MQLLLRHSSVLGAFMWKSPVAILFCHNPDSACGLMGIGGNERSGPSHLLNPPESSSCTDINLSQTSPDTGQNSFDFAM